MKTKINFLKGYLKQVNKQKSKFDQKNINWVNS